MEDHVTHHIQAVLGGLYRACQDEEKIVSEEAVKSANLIGIYMCILICICVVIICIIYIYIYIYIQCSGQDIFRMVVKFYIAFSAVYPVYT